MRTYYRPIPLDPVLSADSALRLAGGWVAFREIECITRGGVPRIIDAGDAPDHVLDRLVAPRDDIAGVSLGAPRLMGILNVTPDSFSDGGRYAGHGAAMAQACVMSREGADFIDIGGESTRPGATEVPVQDEIARVVPVIEALRGSGLETAISIDTRKAEVGRAALQAGANIVNDVSAFRFDANLARVAAEARAPVILMHSLATPDTMQDQPEYDDVLLDVYDALEAAVETAEAAGIPRSRVVVDPGIGFGKTDPHNLALLKRIGIFHSLGCGILLGVSRKGFIGRAANISEADKRDPASATCGLWAIAQGVQILRVHDILVHHQAIALWKTISADEHEE